MDTTNAVRLLWIPVGAGGRVVRRTSAGWERLEAAREHRAPRRLFHAVLEIEVDGARWVVEMAPAWGGPRAQDRGVVRTGPVGLAVLGRSRFFRYEVRCWRDGVLPDRRFAEGAPVLVTDDAATARAMLARVREVPALTWGRAVDGDMWNSNSLVAWLLATSGLPTTEAPPDHGRAPGWAAGLAIATGPFGPPAAPDGEEPGPFGNPCALRRNDITRSSDVPAGVGVRAGGSGVEWIVALAVFAVVSVVVIGVPLYLAMRSWTGRSDRRAAEARRRAASAHPSIATSGRTRKVLQP